MAKQASLLLAIALWFLISEHLRQKSKSGDGESRPPTEITVPEEI